ncbi:MAG: hypothetical protein QME51_01605, partial [Planctomycetota bacterium]|nr:hypothetical protein [Planctomycetota bacterium]
MKRLLLISLAVLLIGIIYIGLGARCLWQDEDKSGSSVSPSVYWKQIASGDSHTLSIKTDGTLWAWGWNYSGQLGNGTNTDRNTPTRVGTDTNWQSVVGGELYTVAVKTNGTLWAWGYNFMGQLGVGDKDDRYSPVQVGTDTNWQSVSAGEWHTLAIKTNGTLWAWGDNSYGQLGLGDSGPLTERLSPVQVTTATDWTRVACGGFHTLAIKTNGTLWAWGSGGGVNGGALGLGDTLICLSPVQVGTDTDWQSVAAGGEWHTLAIKTNGTLWAWGWNNWGQLGLGDTTNRLSPVQVTTATDWTIVACGERHTLAIKTNGTLWAWGNNGNGQLGDGTTQSRTVPTQIAGT